MPQQMRLHRLVNSGPLRVFFYENPEHLPRKGTAPLAKKQGAAGSCPDEMRPAGNKVVRERRRRLPADRHHPLLGALAENADKAVFKVDLLQQQPAELGDAQTAGIEQLQDRPVAQRERVATGGSSQKLGDIAGGKRSRDAAGELGTTQKLGEVIGTQPLAHEVTGKAAQRGELPRQARHGVVVTGERTDPCAHGFAVGRAPVLDPLAREKPGALVEIALVAPPRVHGQAALELQEARKIIDVSGKGRGRSARFVTHGSDPAREQRRLSSAGAAADVGRRSRPSSDT